MAAVLLAAVFLWYGSQVVIMSGTKSTFSHVETKALPGGIAPVSTAPVPAPTKTTTPTPDVGAK